MTSAGAGRWCAPRAISGSPTTITGSSAAAATATRSNPGGFAYQISCFGVATGCSYRGTPETAFSWFPGFSWQLAACRACGAHLGWLFRAPDETFHGFIDDRIKPAGG
jgi:hypothetical protein